MSLVRYSLIRLLLLAAAAVVLYLVGMRGALLWIVAVLVAALTAFIFLPRAHDRAAADLEHIVHRREDAAERPAEDSAEGHEDAISEHQAES